MDVTFLHSDPVVDLVAATDPATGAIECFKLIEGRLKRLDAEITFIQSEDREFDLIPPRALPIARLSAQRQRGAQWKAERGLAGRRWGR